MGKRVKQNSINYGRIIAMVLVAVMALNPLSILHNTYVSAYSVNNDSTIITPAGGVTNSTANLYSLSTDANLLVPELEDTTGYGDVEIAMPAETASTYTLRIALTRDTVGPEQINLTTTEEYVVTLELANGTTEKSAVALSHISWGTLAGQISNIAAGTTVTIEDVVVTTADLDGWGDYTNTYIYLEVVSSDTAETVALDNTSMDLVAGETNLFTVVADVDVSAVQNLTEDTFERRTEDYSSDEGEYSLLYLLNNYNVVSLKDIESTHIVGPIIAQEGAYRTGDSYRGASHDGSDLVASDYSRGVSSYVGKLYTLESDVNVSSLQLGYGFDDDDADFVPPHFYTRATEIDGDGYISVTEVVENWEPFQYVHLSRLGGTFRSPNANGVIDNYNASGWMQEEKTYTYQNDSFIDFDELWETLEAESIALMTDGVLDGETNVITVSSAGTTLEIEAGNSYLIKDATKLQTVNILLPDEYDFFVNPWLPPTTISFEGATINPTTYEGLLVSQFPETLVNGQSLDALQGEGGEYSEVGNKIVWNLPNVVTTGTSNRLVTYGEGVNIAGHIVAVNAEFWNINASSSWEGGNLNGTAIVADFHSGNMEMHMWAYGGLLEQADYVNLQVEKTFENGDLSQQSFQFQLTADSATAEKLEDIYDFPLYATTNSSGTAYFSALVFEEAGDYTFYVQEVLPADWETASITYDQSIYRVDISVSVDSDVADNGYYTTIYSHTCTYTKLVVTEDGTEVSSSATALAFTNSQGLLTDTVSYTFTKVDESGHVLSGATFVLVSGDEIDSSTGEILWENGTEFSCSTAGVVTFPELQPETTYYFKESVAPTGYNLPTGYWSLTVNEYGVISVSPVDHELEIMDNQLVNTLIDSSLANVTLTKENQHGTGLEGAEFQVERLFSMDLHLTVEGGYSATVVSDEDGSIFIAGLPLDGVYRIKEIVAPDGYMIPFNVSYWILEIVSDDTAEDGYTATLYTVDTRDDTVVIDELDNGFVIVNMDVYVLPSTGGAGITFYPATVLLLLCSAVLLNQRQMIQKKKWR